MKRLLSMTIAAVMVLCLVSCGKKSDINGNDKEGIFSELLPSEIYKYSLDGDEYTSKITNLEIVRETTKDDNYDGTARLTLEDDNLKRTIELTLHGRKYDKGGWNLESQSIDNEEITEWKDKSIEKTASDSLDEYGFSSVKYNTSSIKDDKYRMCKMDVTYSSKYLDISGYVEVKLPKTPKIKGNLSYSTYTALGREYETDNLAIQWKVDGSYTCQISDAHKVEVSIRRTPDLSYLWNSKHMYNSDNGAGSEEFDGNINFDRIVFGSGYGTYNGKMDEIVQSCGIGSQCSLKLSPNKIWLKYNYSGEDYELTKV